MLATTGCLNKCKLTQLDTEQTRVEETTLRRWDTAITPQLLTLDVVRGDAAHSAIVALCPVPQAAGYGLRRSLNWRFGAKCCSRGYLGLVLVAMSFIFGPLREGTMGARVFIGVIVGVVFRISQDFSARPVSFSATTP